MPGPGEVCDARAVAGVNVEVFFELGASRDVTVRISSDGYEETLESFPGSLRGIRKKEGDLIHLGYISSYAGAFERAGTYLVEVMRSNQVIERKTVSVRQEKCHVGGESVSFHLLASTPFLKTPGKEYYPLDGGYLLVRDSSIGTAEFVGSTKIWRETEIVRLLWEEITSGDTVSAGSRLEREPIEKQEIGRFSEIGFVSSISKAGNPKDEGGRVIFGK
jgi:hypothetical protein